MFGDDIQGRDCGDEASRWLTRYLGAEKTFRLVHFEPQMRARRSVDTEPLFPQYEVNRSLCCSLFTDFNAIISMLLLQTSIVVLYVRFNSLLIEIATSFYYIYPLILGILYIDFTYRRTGFPFVIVFMMFYLSSRWPTQMSDL